MPCPWRNIRLRGLVCVFAASGVLTACGGGAAAVLEAPIASISVDGDTADWEDVPSETIELEPVLRQDVPPHTATVSVARDATNVYVLFEVSDNLTWTEGDVHKSGAAAVMWRIDDAAATHMGAEAESLGESQGMVDIWHWQLECPAGSTSGGAASATDNGDDPVCDLDDEWSGRRRRGGCRELSSRGVESRWLLLDLRDQQATRDRRCDRCRLERRRQPRPRLLGRRQRRRRLGKPPARRQLRRRMDVAETGPDTGHPLPSQRR